MSLLLQQGCLHTEALHLLLNVGYRLTADDFVLAETGKVLRYPAEKALRDAILQQQGKVPLLSQICRSRIRKHLSNCHGRCGLLRKVSQLPLPHTLMEFLSLKEELGTD